MDVPRLLSAEEFEKLSTDEKHAYINRMIHYLRASRLAPPADSPQPGGDEASGPMREKGDEPGTGSLD